jgi:hypothetical protein
MYRPRVYTVPLAKTTGSTAALDWVELITGTTGSLLLLGVDIGQTTELGDASEEQIRWYVKRATGTYTSGSGGNTSIARPPVSPGDVAATFTAESMNTTQIAVGTGTLTTLFTSVFNLRTGLQLFWTPETAMSCGISSALAIGMGAAPADAVDWEGTVYVGELAP